MLLLYKKEKIGIGLLYFESFEGIRGLAVGGGGVGFWLWDGVGVTGSLKRTTKETKLVLDKNKIYSLFNTKTQNSWWSY